MDYKVSKVELDKIRAKYNSAGDVLFKTALQYVIDCGRQVFENDEWVKEQLDIINKKHDELIKERKLSFVNREFEKAIVECAQEIAQVNAYNLLIYVQKEVWLSDEGIDYKRAMRLLINCMEYIEEYENNENKFTHQAFEEIGFTDDELKVLSYGYLVSNYEEE